MIHSRPDYNRIQDTTGKIPDDEPVFLLRAQDCTAGDVVRYWVSLQPVGPLRDMAERHAVRMDTWKTKKVADISAKQRRGVL